MIASLPGLKLGQAAVVHQACSTVANTLPGGGVVSVGVNYAMFRSWGFPDSASAVSVLITFVWNMFMKLAMPVVALAVMARVGQGGGGLVVAAVVGLASLVGGMSAGV